MFGKITPERKKQQLLTEALDLAAKYRVLALVSSHQAQRSKIDARQHEEMAMHYETIAGNLQGLEQ